MPGSAVRGDLQGESSVLGDVRGIRVVDLAWFAVDFADGDCFGHGFERRSDVSKWCDVWELLTPAGSVS